jgi:hypothetical protein
MLEPVTHVGIRLQVEDPVASLEGLHEQCLVEHVALDELRTIRFEEIGEELAPSAAEVVDDDDLEPVGDQAIGESAADEPGAAGDAHTLHRATA